MCPACCRSRWLLALMNSADRRPNHLVGAILLEQNDGWAVQRARHMTLETITPLGDDPLVSPPAMAV